MMRSSRRPPHRGAPGRVSRRARSPTRAACKKKSKGRVRNPVRVVHEPLVRSRNRGLPVILDDQEIVLFWPVSDLLAGAERRLLLADTYCFNNRRGLYTTQPLPRQQSRSLHTAHETTAPQPLSCQSKGVTRAFPCARRTPPRPLLSHSKPSCAP